MNIPKCYLLKVEKDSEICLIPSGPCDFRNCDNCISDSINLYDGSSEKTMARLLEIKLC